MKLVTPLMNFEYKLCGIFESLSYHLEYEDIDPTIIAANAVLGDRIKKLFLSNFMGMVISVSVIFDTVDTYSCYSSKVDFVNLEEKMLARKIKGTAKGLDIYGFGIVKYSVRIESGRMIALRAQAYYVSELTKDLRIIYPQGIHTPEGYNGTFIAHCHDEHDSHAELNLKEEKQAW